eukprot:gnl/Chilomastix_caulleri/211.p4 GENE.gnl/Chilomastix_caulleri/211~~gnl/Chilomastix_caulleri/211.p4  ORF type:complete len:50 (-),score=3.63 gnl/Chilomastix_caulleri/211:210-359(-)
MYPSALPTCPGEVEIRAYKRFDGSCSIIAGSISLFRRRVLSFLKVFLFP